ncbi:MAG: HAD-IIA family hydrolase [Actinomycetota bacterium]|nr:HAD-IIA family hydrolase [Actinomycetota bacterium]
MTGGSLDPVPTDASHDPRGSLTGGCSGPLSEVYDVALLDCDGVLYLQHEPVEHSAQAVRAVLDGGMRVAYVTNNASRPVAEIAGQLRGFGLPATTADVVTSGQAAARLVTDAVGAGGPVLVLGAEGLREQVAEAGLRQVDGAADGPAAVLQGYDAEMTYARLAEGALAVREGALWVACNLDATIPTPRGLLPGNGSLVAVLSTATGCAPVVAGKPEPALHEEAVRRTAARRPLVVGDRLDTDIEGAVRAGSPSLLVLTGVAGPDDLPGAPPAQRPTYLARDLRGLLEPHPPVRVADGEAFAGDWTARVDGDDITVRGTGDPLNGLRAACGVGWARWPQGHANPRIRGLPEL